MLAEGAIIMSTKKCRLCAKSDDNGVIVTGEENIKKIIPLRIQTYLELEIVPNLISVIRLCRECFNTLDSFQHFYNKVQAAQKVWAKIAFDMGNKEKTMRSNLKRREAKLVPFLIRGLESGRFRGLEWENRTLGLFRLPWPRQGTNKWRPEDSELFKEWAVLKGRYSEKQDFVLWKTCIRTSLHKLPNIREMREYHNFMANPPYKVYCITDFTEKYNLSMKHINEDHNYALGSFTGLYIVGDHAAYTSESPKCIQMSDDSTDYPPESDDQQSSPSLAHQHRTVTPMSVLGSNDWSVAQEETVGGGEESSNTLSPRTQKNGCSSNVYSGMPSDEAVAKLIAGFKQRLHAHLPVSNTNNGAVEVNQVQEPLMSNIRTGPGFYLLAAAAEESSRRALLSSNNSTVVKKEIPDTQNVKPEPFVPSSNVHTNGHSARRPTTTPLSKRATYTRRRCYTKSRQCVKRCADCSTQFESLCDLVKHRQNCPVRSSGAKGCATTELSTQAKFVCEVCERKFATETALKSHVNSHFGVKPYKCNVCLTSFYTSAELQKHKKFH